MRKHVQLLMAFVCAVIALNADLLLAQSTIFNVPTTDTVRKGNVHLELDWLAQNPNTHIDRLHIFSPKVVFGLTRNIEVGATVPIHNKPLAAYDTFFEPNVKWRFASSEKKGIAAAAGAILVTPINDQTFGDTYALVYGNFSKHVSGNYGPRFTAGPYGVLGAGPIWNGPKAGVILGYEQPIHAKASIVADWYSGKNGLGQFTPGLSFTRPARGLLNVGYRFGNDSYGNDKSNRYLFLRRGMTF